MGQYYFIVNLDKKQFIHPHKFGDGMKLMEFACSSPGTMTALAVLLSDGNGRGGGDLQSKNPIIGSWAGDRVVIAGDYADGERFLPSVERRNLNPDEPANVNLFQWADKHFEDISEKIMACILGDRYVRSVMEERNEKSYDDSPLRKCFSEATQS